MSGAAHRPKSRATISPATGFFESHAQNAVLAAAMEIGGGDGKAFDAIELYSCFPCVPKMARRTLGLGADVEPTVTGGLTFFGAPLNTYMTHAACANGAQAARRRQPRPALRPGRLCHQASRAGAVTAGAARGAGAGRQYAGTSRPAEHAGSGVCDRGQRRGHGRKFLPRSMAATTRSSTAWSCCGPRTMRAHWQGVPRRDGQTLTHLLDMDRTPVGSSGDITSAGDGVLEWRVS